jgi:hypothetical protein
MAVKQTAYRLSDEQQATILIECTKCDWRTAYRREELIPALAEGQIQSTLFSPSHEPSKIGLSHGAPHKGGSP